MIQPTQPTNIFIILDKKPSSELQHTYQKNLVRFFKDLKINNTLSINIKLIFVDLFIIEQQLNDVNLAIKENKYTYIFWNKYVAGKNLWLVKQYFKSIVVLENKTILIRKISDDNPINEQLASNNGFHILYMDETKDDVTNIEYKLVIHRDQYLIEQQKLIHTFYHEKQ